MCTVNNTGTHPTKHPIPGRMCQCVASTV